MHARNRLPSTKTHIPFFLPTRDALVLDGGSFVAYISCALQRGNKNKNQKVTRGA